MTITGTDEEQKRAWNLIKELLGEETSSQDVGHMQETEDKSDIDFANFDWTKANQECVCITRIFLCIISIYLIINMILFAGGI